MLSLKQTITVGASALMIVWCLGCNPPQSSSKGENDHGHEHGEHEGHDHEGHDHAQSGPHGGHIIEIGEDEYHAEWTHDDESGKLTIYILDGEMKEAVPIGAEEITIEIVIGKEAKIFQLAAVNSSGDDPPKSSQFEIVDKPLVTAMSVGGAVKATLSLEIAGEVYSVKVSHDEGHDHKH